jgi:hypothetical protein
VYHYNDLDVDEHNIDEQYDE